MLSALIGAARRVGGARLLLPLTALFTRALVVRESARFVVREALRGRGLFLYHLRASGLWVALRHGTGDVVTLGEVWRNRDYDVPDAVAGALGRPAKVLDLGGNIGLFALHVLGLWPQAHVISYEPDPTNAAVARRSREANGLHDRWEVVEAAAGASAGTVSFAAGQDALSHVLEPGENGTAAIEVPRADVLEAISMADLVKLDVEGGEWEIVGDPRFAAAPPRTLVLEYHPRGCPMSDPHVAIRDAMEAAGLRHADIWRRDDGHGMLWAWRA